ncbi:MAG: hypothetical protein IJ324_08020 [Lachnospiraceae bacterium]|nr:hypothetical protein [Lachnospiraceae bacterium]
MANLLDGIRKSEKNEIAKQFCDFKIYNISVMLHMVWQCVCYALMYVCGRIMLLFKKELTLPPVYFWKKRYEMLYESCMEKEKEELTEILLKHLKRKMRLIGLSVNKSEDRLSAEITKVVSRLYPGEALKGLSVLERNDYICKIYPRQKKLDERMCLRLWMIVSVFVLAASMIFFIAKEDLRILIALGCILTEMLWGYWVVYKITQWQLAHLMWISSIGLGHSFAVDTKVSVKYLQGQDKEKCEKDFLIYHTLISLRDSACEQEKRLLLEELIAARELHEKDKLKARWERYFTKLEYKESALSAAVNLFAFDDFARMEHRFGELSQAKDPAALAERRKAEYMVTFKTVQGDIAMIYFTAPKDQNKRLCISRMERKGALKVAPMTKGMLRQHMEKEEYQVASMYQEYLNTLMPKKHKLAEAEKSVKKLEEKLKETENRKQLKEAELLKLKKQIGEREKECEDIRNELAKSGLADLEYEEKRQAFLKTQRQLSSLKEDYKYCEKRYEEITEEYDSCISKKEVFGKDITKLNEKLGEIQKKFFGQLEEMVREMRKSNRRDADYILGELLVKKLSI